MKDLGPLIRLHKLQMDEQRRQLTELRTLLERLQEERSRVDTELAEEQRVAAGSIVVSMTFSAYARQMRLRRENLDRSILQAGQRVEDAEEALADAFRELKRYELAQEERDQRRRQERARRETGTFDEISATRFQRRKDETD